MTLFRAVRAVAESEGDGPVDWDAAAAAAKAAVEPGDLTLTDAEREGYARDVRDARDRVREVAAVDFDLPDTVEVQHRHHWIDANVATFRRVMEPLAEEAVGPVPGLARSVNTGTMGVTLGFLANNVLGQYDPLLLAEGDDHALYFVHPNIGKVAGLLDVPEPRFRRWIAFHEVAHAAEFGAAPWLSELLEERMREGVAGLTEGQFDRAALTEVNVAMTAVEGYAELVMDRAFDEEYDDLRRKLDERRGGKGPIGKLVRRLLGLGMKREQYERGKAFFDAVADERGVEGASAVWDSEANLPTDEELDDPAKWLARVPV
ncbi:zinc-dependent metalloprotease [Halosegnis marinus]|uniref:Zinc-dependent metalloprotease n=1 Tax=Halosegnis marinus TaxID=3034023 RepID=A0ABD5ZKD0_9EURY|nr:zinc-dependent metalloprotease [Halosegnis sp. DT85]